MPEKLNNAGEMQQYDAETGRYGFKSFHKPRNYDAEIKELQEQKRQYSMFSKEGQEIRNKIFQLMAEKEGYSSYEEMQNAKHQEALKREQALEEMRRKEQEKEKNSDYKMSHRPTQSGVYADNLINQDTEAPAPLDLYEHPQYYMNLNEQSDRESWDALKQVRGKPNATIKIYRATTGDKINDGDWITLSKTYAKEHNLHSLEGKGKIVEMEVPVKDIEWAMDSINEWGYFPKHK